MVVPPGAAALQRGVLQQFSEHDCSAPLREVFIRSQPWLPSQRNPGKHPFELMDWPGEGTTTWRV